MTLADTVNARLLNKDVVLLLSLTDVMEVE